MKEPKQWNQFTEEEKKSYRTRSWILAIAQFGAFLAMIAIFILLFTHLQTVKDYQNPCAFCIEKTGLSCTLYGNPVEIKEGGIVVTKNVLPDFGDLYKRRVK